MYAPYNIPHGLTIYSASAGSGKTYTLSKEYIKLLLEYADKHQIFDYHLNILAVTFTNKATEEMKNRIVNLLSDLAKGNDLLYLQALADDTGIDITRIPKLAGEVLSHILHDYSRFSILTIDSFFQRVIRAFAREMNLYAGYAVELDQASVLENAVDMMLDNVDENTYLKDWLVDWAKRKIDSGRSWNIQADMHSLGYEIFSEDLKKIPQDVLNDITEKARLEPYRHQLEKQVDDYNIYLRNIGKRALHIISSHGLTVQDFSQKEKGVAGYFQKLAEGREASINTYIEAALADVEGWYSKTSKSKADIEHAYGSGLSLMLQDAVDYQLANARQINTAQEILKQLNVLGVLSDLMAYVKEYAHDQNLFLISESSGFLHKIIDHADAPFIYERVGSFYHHFMIDEFQDTSAFQWENFLPLVHNSLASGNNDWIVGDVKQSIYRWRNTDWEILAKQVERDLRGQNIVKKSLETNWRSAPEVVNFNNAFFRTAVQQLKQAFLHDEQASADDEQYLQTLVADLETAYSDCYQQIASKNAGSKGFVRVSVVADKDEEDWYDQVMAELPIRIEQLQDLGYRLSDIAILVRSNKEAQAIADMLLAYGQDHPGYRYDVLSNESLLIDNSPSVKWLVAAIRFIVDPADSINKAFLQYEYRNYMQHDHANFVDIITTHEEQLAQWRGIPVYELTELLIKENGLLANEVQAPFLQAFQDMLLQYIRREATDLRSFLGWWDDNKHKKFVTMPDGQDAIRLVTIHKSKGLEFDVVMVPFCDWPLAQQGKILWCEPHEKPFNEMKLLPLRFSSNLRDTIFVNDFLKEKMFSYIDNLNLLYVAFTRACKALFVYTPQQKKNKQGADESFTYIRNLIHAVYNEPADELTLEDAYIRMEDYWHPDISCFELGQLVPLQKKAEPVQQELTGYFTANHANFNIAHITRNSEYFSVEKPQYIARMDRGRLLHDVFRHMTHISDLEKQLNILMAEGKLSEQEYGQILTSARQALANPIVQQWFSPGIQVKAEAEILLPNGGMYRPDRVVITSTDIQVIDYKFGEAELSVYRKQVAYYMDLLSSMGYPHVKGFIWYVTLNKVEEIG